MCGWSPKKYLHLYLGKCKGKGKVHVMDGLNGMQSRYQAATIAWNTRETGDINNATLLNLITLLYLNLSI